MKGSIFFNIAVGSLVGLLGVGPIQSFESRANINSNYSVIQYGQETEQEYYRERTQKAKENWNKLTKAQKEEVYKLVNNRLKENNKILDKLVEFGVMDKADAESIKNKRIEKFNSMKEAGEFPLSRQKCNTDK